jgi:hypothetical protein
MSSSSAPTVDQNGEPAASKDKETTTTATTPPNAFETELRYFLNRPLANAPSPTADRLYWTWRKSVSKKLKAMGVSSHLLQPAMSYADVTMWSYFSSLQCEALKATVEGCQDSNAKPGVPVTSKDQKTEAKRKCALEIVKLFVLKVLEGQCTDLQHTAKEVLAKVDKKRLLYSSRNYDLFDRSGKENLTSSAKSNVAGGKVKNPLGKADDRTGSVHINVFDNLGKIFMDRPCGDTRDKSFTTTSTPPWMFSYSSKPLMCLVDTGAIVSMFLKELKTALGIERFAPVVNLVYAACRTEGESDDKGDLGNDVPPENVVYVDWSSRETLTKTEGAVAEDAGGGTGVDPKVLERGKGLCMMALDVMGKTQHSSVIVDCICAWMADREWLDSKTVFGSPKDVSDAEEPALVIDDGNFETPLVVKAEERATVERKDDSLLRYLAEHPNLLSGSIKKVTEGVNLNPGGETPPVQLEKYLDEFEKTVYSQIERYGIDCEETGREAVETVFIVGTMCCLRNKIEEYYVQYQRVVQEMASTFWLECFVESDPSDLGETQIFDRITDPLSARNPDTVKKATKFAKVFLYNADPKKLDQDLHKDEFYLRWMTDLLICTVSPESWDKFPETDEREEEEEEEEEGKEAEYESLFMPWWLQSVADERRQLFGPFDKSNAKLKTFLGKLGFLRAKYESIYSNCVIEQVSLVKVLLQNARHESPKIANETCLNYLKYFYDRPFAKELEEFKKLASRDPSEIKEDPPKIASLSTFPIKNMYPRAYCPVYMNLVNFCLTLPELVKADAAFPEAQRDYLPVNAADEDDVTVAWPWIPFDGEKLDQIDDSTSGSWYRSYCQNNLPFGGIERIRIAKDGDGTNKPAVTPSTTIKPISVRYCSTDYAYFMNLALSACFGNINDAKESEALLLDLVQNLEEAFSSLFSCYLYDNTGRKKKAERKQLNRRVERLFDFGSFRGNPGVVYKRLARFLTNFRTLEQRCMSLIKLRDVETSAGRSFDSSRDPTLRYLKPEPVLRIVANHFSKPVRANVVEAMKKISHLPVEEHPLAIPGNCDSQEFFLRSGWCSDFFMNVFGIRDCDEPQLPEVNFMLFLKFLVFDAKSPPERLQEKRRFLSKIASIKAGMGMTRGVSPPVPSCVGETTTTTTTITTTS